MPTQVPHDHETPGALERIADDPHNRKKFLSMAGVGAAGALSVFLAACGDDAKKTTSAAAPAATTKTTAPTTADVKSDLEIVQYALTLEYLEAQFYKDVVASGLFKGADQDAIKTFGDQEQQHVDALTATVKQLGGTPVEAPMAKFPLKDAKSVLKLAATVENLGAAAYLGQAPRIKSAEILAAALSIHSVEGRHAAALNTLIGESPTPDGPFAKPADMATVLAAVKPFIVS